MIQFAQDHLGRRRDVVKRVILDGRDVTQNCLAFDPETGFIALVERDRMGRRVRNRIGRGKRTFKRGQIRVVRGDRRYKPDREFICVDYNVTALTWGGAVKQIPHIGDQHMFMNATAIRLDLRRSSPWRFWRWISETTYKMNDD